MTITADDTRTATTGATTGPGTDPEVKAVRKRVPRIWKAAGVLLIVAGAIAAMAIYSGASRATQVFVATDTITRGSVIGQDDLSTISITADQSTTAFPVSRADDVTGTIAAVDIPAGGLITTTSVTSALDVPTGQALVGLTLKPGQLPAQTLTAGDTVYLVPVPPQGVATAPDALPTSDATIPATVSQVTAIENTNDVIVDVYVSVQSAPQITAQAAAGTLAIYLVAGTD